MTDPTNVSCLNFRCDSLKIAPLETSLPLVCRFGGVREQLFVPLKDTPHQPQASLNGRLRNRARLKREPDTKGKSLAQAVQDEIHD
jgi:hypothetical protein